MTLTDANSRNGVTLKGQKLAPSVAAPLASGDTFILGTLAFVYYSGAAFYDFVKKDILKQG
jgi:pSer/pThr/pTyr-binding forkhead associated (FHA) protein